MDEEIFGEGGIPIQRQDLAQMEDNIQTLR